MRKSAVKCCLQDMTGLSLSGTHTAAVVCTKSKHQAQLLALRLGGSEPPVTPDLGVSDSPGTREHWYLDAYTDTKTYTFAKLKIK